MRSQENYCQITNMCERICPKQILQRKWLRVCCMILVPLLLPKEGLAREHTKDCPGREGDRFLSEPSLVENDHMTRKVVKCVWNVGLAWFGTKKGPAAWGSRVGVAALGWTCWYSRVLKKECCMGEKWWITQGFLTRPARSQVSQQKKIKMDTMFLDTNSKVCNLLS